MTRADFGSPLDSKDYTMGKLEKVGSKFFSVMAAFAASQAASSIARAEGDTSLNFKRTDSGLQYMDIKNGDGASPAAGDTVRVHYTGGCNF